MRNDNQHLNVFRSYTQNNKNPVENNMSRGLAILFEQYPELFYLFIANVNEKIDNKIKLDYSLLAGDYSINIQKTYYKGNNEGNVSNNYSRIIGIGLTGNESIKNFIYKDVKPVNKVILDIEIVWNDIVFIIECKRNEDNPIKQLNEQISTYISSKGKPESQICNCHISWNEILLLLEKFKSKSWLSEQYYDYIASARPDLIPTKKLNELDNRMNNFVTMVNKRLSKIKNIYIEQYNEKNNEKIISNIMPLDNMQYCKWMDLKYDGQERKVFYTIWIGDGGIEQLDEFDKKCDLQEFEKYLNAKNTLIMISDKECQFTILPYVKCSAYKHDNGSSCWLYFKQNIEYSSVKEFAKKNNGCWKRDKDKENNFKLMRENIVTSNLFDNSTINEIDEKFIHSDYKQCNMIVAYECSILMDFEDAKELDRVNKLGGTIIEALERFRGLLNKKENKN